MLCGVCSKFVKIEQVKIELVNSIALTVQLCQIFDVVVL